MFKNRNTHKKHKGMALVIVLIFVTVFSALSIAMFSLSSGNVIAVQNVHQGNSARAVAESGLELLRFIVDGSQISGSDPDVRMYHLYGHIQNRLNAAGMSNVTLQWDNGVIGLSGITLDASQGENITIQLQKDTLNPEENLVAQVTGTHRDISRSIRVQFEYSDRAHPIFDYGIATKGPLLMSGQASVAGVNEPTEADVFIDGDFVLGDSFNIGNQASVAGDVHIVDSDAAYTIGKKSSVGGATGSAADDHVFIGVDPVDFPTPNTEYFRQFATGDIIDSTSNISNYAVLNNVTIAANTNPTFASHVRINGVLFIEQPNDVKFAGQVDVAGVIVGDSDAGESVGSLNFSGQVECVDTSTLQGSEFENIKKEDGTFIMAPGFSADFSGQANTINGAIAVGGVRFTGQAGGQINGSIINYSDDPMEMQGQSELRFNRKGKTGNPAGFQPIKILGFDATAYEELH